MDVGKVFVFGKFMILPCSVRIQRDTGIRNAENQGRRCALSRTGSSVLYRTMTKKTSPWMAADPGPMPRVSAATLPRLSRKFAVLNCALFHGIRHYLQFAKVVHMDETTMAFLVPREEASAALAAINGHLAVAGLSITREDVLTLAEQRAELLAEVERMCPDYKGLHVNLYDLLIPHEGELVRAASRARQT